MQSTNTSVFISYSWEDESLIPLVERLALDLKARGVSVTFDRFELGPDATGWESWCLDRLRSARVVLAVCSENYRRRFYLAGEKRGCGVTLESTILSRVARAGGREHGVFPLLLAGQDLASVLPKFFPENVRSFRYPEDLNRLLLTIAQCAGNPPERHRQQADSQSDLIDQCVETSLSHLNRWLLTLPPTIATTSIVKRFESVILCRLARAALVDLMQGLALRTHRVFLADQQNARFQWDGVWYRVAFQEDVKDALLTMRVFSDEDELPQVHSPEATVPGAPFLRVTVMYPRRFERWHTEMVTVIQRLVDLTTNRIIGILLPNAGASTEAPSKDLHRLLYGSIPESLQNDVWLYGLNGSVGNVLLDTNRIGMVTRLLRQDHRPTRGSDLFRIAVFSGAALKRESTFSNQALACSQPLPCEIRSNAYSVGTSDYEDAEIAILRSDHVVFRPILRHDPLGITIAYPADAETTIQSSLHDFERTISNPLRSWARDNLDTYLTSLQVRQHGLREVDDNLLPLDDELGEDR